MKERSSVARLGNRPQLLKNIAIHPPLEIARDYANPVAVASGISLTNARSDISLIRIIFPRDADGLSFARRP